ncbi:hypothetical protein [Nostoc sp.]|uniref:hypothetical protein n=1 Tax=Nostoc sp. TaxID=1180 RepID=UPI0035948E4B
MTTSKNIAKSKFLGSVTNDDPLSKLVFFEFWTDQRRAIALWCRIIYGNFSVVMMAFQKRYEVICSFTLGNSQQKTMLNLVSRLFIR